MLNRKLSQITEEDFKFLIKNGKRSSKLLNFDFESLIFLRWGILKEKLPELFERNDFEKLFLLMLKDRGNNFFLIDIQKISVREAMSFILWIIDEMKSIQDLEIKYLKSDPNPKMLQAGINNLDQFGILNTLDNLSGGDILKYDLIRNIPYNIVFDKQYMEVVKSGIENKLAKIK